MERKGQVVWWILGIVIVIVAGLLIWMWVGDNDATNDTTDTQQQQETTQEEQSRLEEITTDPQSFVGQTVTVDGEVQDSINNRVFSIADDPVEEEVLVVARNPLTDEQVAEIEPLFQDNPNVEVTGEFRQFVAADLESELGLDFDQEVEAEFENQYAIIADSLTFTDGGQEFDFLDANETNNTNQNETGQEGTEQEETNEQNSGNPQ